MGTNLDLQQISMLGGRMEFLGRRRSYAPTVRIFVWKSGKSTYRRGTGREKCKPQGRKVEG